MRKSEALVCAGCTLLLALYFSREVQSHNPVTTTVLFNREVSGILQRKCAQCHAPGALAMPLTTYDETRPWAVAMKEQILGRRMPPWSAERGYGQFSNDGGLTNREREFLVSWIDGGVPQGDGEPPQYIDHSGHWMLGTPDAVVTASTGVTVDAGATVSLKRVFIDSGLTQDRWVRGFDYKPDKRVVRAAFLTVEATGEYLGTWTPSRPGGELPAGVAIRVPARSRIVVDVLYQPPTNVLSGTAPEPVTDTPQLGLYFSAAAPKYTLKTTALASSPVAGVKTGNATRATASTVLPTDTALFEMRPELPAGGRSIEVKAKLPDGSSEVLLWISRFDPQWQGSYLLRHPTALPKGTTLQAIAYVEGADARQAQFRLTFTGYETPPPPTPRSR